LIGSGEVSVMPMKRCLKGLTAGRQTDRKPLPIVKKKLIGLERPEGSRPSESVCYQARVFTEEQYSAFSERGKCHSKHGMETSGSAPNKSGTGEPQPFDIARGGEVGETVEKGE